MDDVRKLIRDKVEELDLSLAWLSRQVGRNSGYLFDFLEKGSPRALPEPERKLLASKLGISEDYLRANSGVMHTSTTVEGEQIEPDAIRNTVIRDRIKRELKDAKKGEAWIIHTPLIEAQYPPGTYVVVDTAQPAYERDFVLAEVWHGKEKQIVFRLYLPPTLVCAVAGSQGVRGLIVDRENVIIRGVIRIGFR